MREKQIDFLIDFCERVHESQISENLLGEIVQVLKNLRIISVNIINNFTKIKDNCNSFLCYDMSNNKDGYSSKLHSYS